jgi:hypothetical protein
MIEALRAAGFLGVESDGPKLHARLWASSVEFTATPDDHGWTLALHWPVRTSQAQRDGWNKTHPTAQMDLDLGETRLSMQVPEGDPQALIVWSAIAEQAIAHLTRWRRAQRQPGEGM